MGVVLNAPISDLNLLAVSGRAIRFLGRDSDGCSPF